MNRMEGVFYGAALGSALAKATHDLDRYCIPRQYGGPVATLCPAPAGFLFAGYPAGRVCGQYRAPLLLAEDMICHGGEVTAGAGLRITKAWAREPDFLQVSDRTSQLLCRMEPTSGLPRRQWIWVGNYFAMSSESLAVKAFPVGARYGADQDAIVRGMGNLVFPENDVQTVAAGTAAAFMVGCAVSGGARGDILQAALEGAKRGRALGEALGVRVHPGPDLCRRIALAVQLLSGGAALERRLDDLYDLIGCGIAASELIPAVVGVIVSGGSAMELILRAVNLGNNSASVSMLVGAVAGGMAGVEALDQELLEQVFAHTPYAVKDVPARLRGSVGCGVGRDRRAPRNGAAEKA